MSVLGAIRSEVQVLGGGGKISRTYEHDIHKTDEPISLQHLLQSEVLDCSTGRTCFQFLLHFGPFYSVFVIAS